MLPPGYRIFVVASVKTVCGRDVRETFVSHFSLGRSVLILTTGRWSYFGYRTIVLTLHILLWTSAVIWRSALDFRRRRRRRG